MIARNPVAAYCVAVWSVAFGLAVHEVAQHHPRALVVAAGPLLAMLCGRVVSLAEELRTLRGSGGSR